MVYVATQMQARGPKLPLLIGGATTSRQHTAVKVAPAYDGPVVHVADASRVIDVMSQLLSPTQRDAGSPRPPGASRRSCARSTRPARIARRWPTPRRWPTACGSTCRSRRRSRRSSAPARVEVPLAELVPYIDWTFFFAAWELKGRFPAILDHPEQGAAARELYENARTLLDQIVAREQLTARGVYGFWPAASDGDDIVVFKRGDRGAGDRGPGKS